ncbi:hypothetical protein [Estrella lausannensis]|uniref:Uncharacterized protein n=1 Tax=Estrella lausannensis TaxID=483423 RepID=A0A0H5DSQ0_9BACT|nr:hypothetical protein [Estrella lausannensis]CRX38824.1 hypothetical protein ELAC_1492 [Estrella lausannensis]
MLPLGPKMTTTDTGSDASDKEPPQESESSVASFATRALSSSMEASPGYSIPRLRYIPTNPEDEIREMPFHQSAVKRSYPLRHVLNGFGWRRKGDSSPRRPEASGKDKIQRNTENPQERSDKQVSAEFPLLSSKRASIFDRRLTDELQDRVSKESGGIRVSPEGCIRKLVWEALESTMARVKEFEHIEQEQMFHLLPHMSKAVMERVERDGSLFIDLDLSIERILKNLRQILLESKKRTHLSDQMEKWAEEGVGLFRAAPFSLKALLAWVKKGSENECLLEILLKSLSRDRSEAERYLSEINQWTGFFGKIAIEKCLMEEIRKCFLMVNTTEGKFIWKDEGLLESMLEKIDMEQVERSICVDNGTFLPERFVINGRDLALPSLCKEALETKRAFFESILGRIYSAGLHPSSTLGDTAGEVSKFFARREFIGYDLLRVTSISAWSHFDAIFRSMFPPLFLAPYSTRSASGLSVFINVISEKKYEVILEKTYRVYPLLNPMTPGSFAIDAESPLTEVVIRGHVMTEEGRCFKRNRTCMLEFPQIVFLKAVDSLNRSRLMQILGNPSSDVPFRAPLPTDARLLGVLDSFTEEMMSGGVQG